MRTGSELHQAMRKLCSRGWLSLSTGPWRFGDVAVATDALVFVAVPLSELSGEVCAELPEKLQERVSLMLSVAPTAPIATTAERLREFAGPPFVCGACSAPTPPPCDRCEGTGEVDCTCECGHDHEAPCEDCDGKGKMLCHCDSGRRVVKVADRVVNAYRLAAALAILEPSGPVVVSGDTVKGMGVLTVAGESWRIVVAPIDRYEPEAVFEPSVAA